MKHSLAYAWFGGIALGLGAATALTAKSCGADKEYEASPLLTPPSASRPYHTPLLEPLEPTKLPSSQPSDPVPATTSPSLEQRLAITYTPSQKTFYEVAWQYWFSESDARFYKREGFVDNLIALIEKGKALPMDTILQELFQKKDAQVQGFLQTMYGSQEAITAARQRLERLPAKTTLEQYALQENTLNTKALEKISLGLWYDQGIGTLWVGQFAHQSFLEGAVNNYAFLRQRQKIGNTNLVTFIEALTAVLTSDGKIAPYTEEQLQQIRQAARNYDLHPSTEQENEVRRTLTRATDTNPFQVTARRLREHYPRLADMYIVGKFLQQGK